jgi:hypothetical protein
VNEAHLFMSRLVHRIPLLVQQKVVSRLLPSLPSEFDGDSRIGGPMRTTFVSLMILGVLLTFGCGEDDSFVINTAQDENGSFQQAAENRPASSTADNGSVASSTNEDSAGREMLPSTASQWPVYGITGLVSIFLGFAIRRCR